MRNEAAYNYVDKKYLFTPVVIYWSMPQLVCQKKKLAISVCFLSARLDSSHTAIYQQVVQTGNSWIKGLLFELILENKKSSRTRTNVIKRMPSFILIYHLSCVCESLNMS